MTAFPDLEVTMDDLLDEGEKVIYIWILSGANTGSGGTGKRVRINTQGESSQYDPLQIRASSCTAAWVFIETSRSIPTGGRRIDHDWRINCDTNDVR